MAHIMKWASTSIAFAIYVAILLLFQSVAIESFHIRPPPSFQTWQNLHHLSQTSVRVKLTSIQNQSPPSPPLPKAQPRKGLLQYLLDVTLASPIYQVLLVPLARQNILKTAEANGIPWSDCLAWISSQKFSPEDAHLENVPKYYQRPFHAYSNGNLCWEAAFEAEIASRAIGARNFPLAKDDGEDLFRGSFDDSLVRLGAVKDVTGVVVDMGCGVGTSTRRLAVQFPHANRVVGIDLSPYFVSVGRKLLELSPKSYKEGGKWVTSIQPDDRIEYKIGDAANTALPSESVAVVSLMLVIHELPLNATKKIFAEAHRILAPGGQLWIGEMDFDSPAYAAQRANPLLFSLVRATEPYLDEYADGCEEMRTFLGRLFEKVNIGAATGRHFAIVATKGNGLVDDEGIAGRDLYDYRFNSDGSYAVQDTHLMTWESKK